MSIGWRLDTAARAGTPARQPGEDAGGPLERGQLTRTAAVLGG